MSAFFTGVLDSRPPTAENGTSGHETPGMELHLEGKSALITGGSAGIGLACARVLRAEGVDVAIASRSAERLRDAAAALNALPARGSGRVRTIAGDMTRADDVERIAREATAAFGKIDILINNAGSAMGGSFVELRDDDFLGAWTLKLLGYIRMTRAIVPQMIERRDGRIVNIIGGAARTPTANFLPGSTANAALLNFTRGLSKDLAAHNVRINAISPGTTATERAERLIESEATNGTSIDDARNARLANIPMRIMTQPDEIAAMAALLVSGRMASMTGAEVLIDGGATPGV